MSDIAADPLPTPSPKPGGKSFVFHAKLIGVITLVSRVLGLARESIAAHYFGAGAIWSAFTVAFTIPNLFRKLFGEGALSAAFIPLYAQAVQRAAGGGGESATSNQQPATHPNDFAAASVNLLVAMLLALTILGELILLALAIFGDYAQRPDYLLAIKLTALMLPYVLLVCGTAFLGAILQVHDRFAMTAATAIVLNAVLIVAMVLAARQFDLSTEAGQIAGVWWLSVAVLIAGVLQVVMLLPSLRAAGFRFRLMVHFWTPAVRQMIRLSIPVALGAGVLQLGVLLDKGIALLLAEAHGQTHFSLLGWTIRYPMQEGAAARLNWAQFMYQFPLGVFAIALATAIFPKLSEGALEADRTQFKRILRQGVEGSLFIGLPASAGMVIVATPAIRLLFERGEFTPHDTYLTAFSTAVYSSAIWAFSLQQILNRAYYALHDTMTPLIWMGVNLLLNLVVELPLIWTGLGEVGMAFGTLVSFSIQAVVMLWMLSGRVGGIGLRQSFPRILKMFLATVAMIGACLAVQHLPFWNDGTRSRDAAIQLVWLMMVGGIVYFGICAILGIDVLRHIRPRRIGSGREVSLPE